jgi:spermidine/putrescine transport system permease protein
MKGQSGFEKGYIALILVLMYVPIALVIIYSFNESRLNAVWTVFSLKWYRELLRDRTMFNALRNSLVLALLSSFAAAIIGTLGAVGFRRAQSSAHIRKYKALGTANKILEYLSILPIMTPEIILGMVFLAFFSLLGLPLGMLTLVIAHTSFSIPYVYLLVKARLAGLDKSYAEAAKDLGAGEWRAFFDITLPLIMPAIISGVLLAFAMSFDDVIISSFVTGARTNTLPIRIYSQIKTGVTPKTNALCTLLFGATIILGLFSAYLAKPRKNGHTTLARRKK